MSAYTLPDLPYDYAALESRTTRPRSLELHHDKHHATYVAGANTTLEKLAEARNSGDFATINQLEKNLAFHVGGHVLHSLFWKNLSPDGGGKPEGELAAAIDDAFGSFGRFKAQMTQASTTIQELRMGRASRGSHSAVASSSSRSSTTRATSPSARSRCS